MTVSSHNTLDALAADLQRLRVEAGDVSYADLAARVGALREARGQSAAEARVARSSVFDTFRQGRKRINPDLVADIVLALGLDQQEAEEWRARCLRARAAARERRADEMSSKVLSTAASAASIRPSVLIVVMVACVGLNLFGGTVMAKFQLPLYLDMIGTAIGAVALGPWHGVLIGLATNVLDGVAADFDTSLPFAFVNAVGAVVWGYGVRKWGLGRTWPRVFTLNTIVALACSIVAVPITVLVFGGAAAHPIDAMTSELTALGEPLWTAVLSTNLAASLGDKLLSGAIAIVAVRLLSQHGVTPMDVSLLPPVFVRSSR